MNTEKIITAIAQKLDMTFPDEMVYTEDIEQDMQTPCFFILEIEESMHPGLGRRCEKAHSFDIHYFPENRSYAEINAVSDVLYSILETIDTGECMIRGTDMRARTEDYVLHFFADYNVFLLKSREKEPEMGAAQVDVEKKG